MSCKNINCITIKQMYETLTEDYYRVILEGIENDLENKSLPNPVFEAKEVIVLVAIVAKESFLPIPSIANLTTPRGLPSSTIASLNERMSVFLVDKDIRGET